MTIQLLIEGQPVAKERARVYLARNGNVRAVTPPRTRAWEDELRWRMREVYKGEPDAESFFSLFAFFAFTGRDRDIDNLVKCVMDAGNRLLWKDDRQVTAIVARKKLVPDHPYASILITSESEVANP